ncbi:MAG TPA: FAD-binding oxidoreductase [Steroidobacteraceae bacterium]|nr:FAD-binding oxidoreductase [Steroidobacteraceae bacterium]
MDLPARLRELVGTAAVLTGPDELAPCLTDHRGLYRGAAAAMVLPGSTEQVAQVLAFCHAHRVPVVPQGGNTGYCGGATPDASGRAVLLAMRRMNRIRHVDAANFSLVAEAGCTLAAVQDAAAAAGRLFPLSLGSEGSCQIGGNLATNAGGTAVLRYGTARDLTLGIECVLADGSVIAQLSPLRKNNTGYDLKNLLIGSEGTLGVITAACLKLFPQPHLHATAWVGIPSPAAAVELLARLRAATGDALATLELVPEVALELVLRHVPAARHPGISDSPWHLLVEVPDTGRGDAEAALTTALQQASEVGLVTDAAIALNAAQREDFWQLRESVPEAQRRAGGSLKHDVAVPVASIPSFIEAGAQLCARMAPEGYLVAYGHAGDGNLHFNLNQREGADKAAFLAREAPLRRAVHDLVASYGGTFSAEHGIGQLKVDELRRYASPAGLAAMHRIKQALDPHHILNPGKVL